MSHARRLPLSAGRLHSILCLCWASCGSLLGVTPSVAEATPELVTLQEEAIMPIPLGPNEARVRTAIREEDWKTAGRLLRPPFADTSVQFLKAWLYQKAKAWPEVLSSLEGLERDPRLKDAVLTLRAEASLELEDYHGCEQASAQVSKGDMQVYHEALRYRAKALRALKRWDESRSASLELLKSDEADDRAVARLGLALTDLAQGRAEDAIRAIKLLDIKYPRSWSARRAKQEASTLMKKDKRLELIWRERSPAEQALKVSALMEARQYSEVVKEASALLRQALPDDLRCKLLVLKGRAYDKTRKRRDALRTLKEAVELCDPQRHEDTPVALYVAGRAADILDQDRDLEDLFWRLFEGYKHRLSDDAAVFLIRYYSELGVDFKPAEPAKKIAQRGKGKKGRRASKRTKKRKRAQSKRSARRFDPKWLDKVMKVARLIPKLHPEGDLSSEALTFAFVAAMRAKKYKPAEELLGLMGQLAPHDFSYYSSGRLDYWRGRLSALKGRHKEAQKHYIRAINSAPISWYAILSYSRLYERDRAFAERVVRESLETPRGALGLPGGEKEHWTWKISTKDPRWPEVERALMWLRLGLERRGRHKLLELAHDERRPDLQWLSAWIFDAFEMYHWSHDIPRRQLIEYRHFPIVGSTRKHWELAFPAPYSRPVKKAAQDEGLDESFIWGVMREESGYAPAVRSHASAVGLLQLLVPTANMMVRRGEKKVDAQELSKPSVNIPLGARYLAWVKRSASCAWALVPAGYNAGHGALKRWLRERGELPLDLFVETIPYQEARWYLKRVNASWATFKTLYGRRANQPIWPYVSQKTREESR